MRRIYWVGQPIMPDPKFDSQIKVINDIYRSEAAKQPGVEYVDAWALFGEPERRIRAVLA